MNTTITTQKLCFQVFAFFLCLALGSIATAATTVGGTITKSTTWKASSSPYLVTSDLFVEGSGSPVLTIQAGVRVQIAQGKKIHIGENNNGALSVTGTSASLVTFTANTATPTPGYWQGIYFGANTQTSTIAFARVEYGVYGVNSTAAAPLTIHHVTFSSNSSVGVYANPSVSLYANDFVANTGKAAQGTNTPTDLIAQLCWWGSASGPATSGANSVVKVVYDPWLIGTSSSTSYFKSFTIKNRTFNPSISIRTTITFATAVSAGWSVVFSNSGGQAVKTFSGSGSSATVIWDGKSDSGVAQPTGTYTYVLQSASATSAKGTVAINTTLALTISNLNAAWPVFSPDGDGQKETTTVGGTISYPDSTWTLNIKNSAGAVVRTATGNGPAISYVWDGKNSSGTIVADGVYSMEVTATDDGASVIQSTSAAPLIRTSTSGCSITVWAPILPRGSGLVRGWQKQMS